MNMPEKLGRQMKYRKLGRTGVNVSEICLGTATFGNEVADEKESIKLIRDAYEQGINFFDTANTYSEGRSEEILGKAVKDFRDQVILATKVWCKVGNGANDESTSAYHIIREVENSLRRLQTDYIDLYYIHWPDWKYSWDARYGTRHHDVGKRKTSVDWVEWETPPEEPIKAIDILIKQGKVRYLGCSNYPAWLVCKGLWYSDVKNLASFMCVQTRYNLLFRHEERELLPFCREENVGVTTYAPIEGGLLSGKYKRGSSLAVEGRDMARSAVEEGLIPEAWDVIDKLCEIAEERGKTPSQIALAWILSRPAITAPVIGVTKRKQLDDNLVASGLELSADEVRRLDEVSAFFRGSEAWGR